MTKGIVDKIIRYKKELDNYAAGKYAAIPLDRIADYAAWLDQYDKVPGCVSGSLIEYVTAIFEKDDEVIMLYHNMPDFNKMVRESCESFSARRKSLRPITAKEIQP